MTKKMDQILARYFGGNASRNEMEALELWLSSDKKNQQHFDELTILYRRMGCLDHQIPSPNIKQAKAKFMAYMDGTEQALPMNSNTGRLNPFYKSWMFLAASVLILFSISYSIWYFDFSVRDILLTTGKSRMEKVLPDGTQIFLSKNSQITYRSDFGKKDKKIHLIGEATFHAGHKGEGRLQILTDRLVIEDIGTIFTISAYPDSNNIVVSVKEGQVHLLSGKNKGFRLSANEICRFDKQNETFHPGNKEKDQEKYLSYKQPLLPLKSQVQATDISLKRYHYEFDSEPLNAVVETISKEYGVNIGIENPSIDMQEITVHFDQEKLEVVLQIIAETMNLMVKKVDDGYMLCSK